MGNLRLDLLFGGLGIFLFGIKYMGDGLKALAGDRLKTIIDKYTSTPIKGIFIGTIVTVLIQSSSATTALAIGLIRSGMMTLTQAVGIIMGANIGTTITAFLIGLNVSEYALYFVAVGAFFIMFSQKKSRQYLGQTILGFGCLFFGLTMMGDSLSALESMPWFITFMSYISMNPWVALLVGIGLTTVIQSSSAVIGILQLFYAEGAITLSAAMPALFGSNIGTTITAILAALGGSLSAKRAAGIHVMFNVIGSLFFMIILIPFSHFINFIASMWHLEPAMQLALIHGIFNIAVTALLYPFTNLMVKIVKKIIPGEEFKIDINLEELNPKIANTFPSHALEIAKVKTINMGEVAKEMVELTTDYIDGDASNEMYDKLMQYEDIINMMDDKITHYLMEIAHEQMSNQDTIEYQSILQVLKDLERIGDHCKNLADYFKTIHEGKHRVSEGALQDINKMLDLVIEMIKESMLSFETGENQLSELVIEKEDLLDKINYKSRQRHIKRVKEKEEKSALVSSIFVDIISNIERMGDHCSNIATVYFQDYAE